MIEVKREEIEVIKLGVRGLEYQGISVPDTLLGSIGFLHECFERNRDRGYLHAAVARIQAFLELGFYYERGGQLFDQILSELNLTRAEQFPKRSYAARQIPLTKPQIRRLIKPWSSSKYHTMSIEQVPEDIIGKVKRKEFGVYEYHSNANPAGREYDHVYILYVDEDDSYIYNVQRGKYFLLVKQEGENEDRDS